jgi:hypothetical protein
MGFPLTGGRPIRSGRERVKPPPYSPAGLIPRGHGTIYGAVPTIRDKSKKAEELQLLLQGPTPPEYKAKKWLEETTHRPGCQCHRCAWAHGVIAGRISVSFEDWRKG